MKKILLLGLLTVGCASMNEKVFTKIRVGDSSQKLIAVLGTPDLFQPSALYKDGNAWVYRDKNMACGFSIVDDKIKDITCRSKGSLQDQSSLLARVFIEE